MPWHGQSLFLMIDLIPSGHLEQVDGQEKMGFWEIVGIRAVDAIIRGLLCAQTLSKEVLLLEAGTKQHEHLEDVQSLLGKDVGLWHSFGGLSPGLLVKTLTWHSVLTGSHSSIHLFSHKALEPATRNAYLV